MSLFQLSNLTKDYRNTENQTLALRGLDLTIEEGSTLAILGPSGAGKSTLLHILGTLETPTSGTVLYKNKPLFGQSEADLCEFRNRKMGFVFQFHHLLPDFTVLENVLMPLYIRGDNSRKSLERAQEILSQVGLQKKLKSYPIHLSGGEQQRVAIARALAGGPEVILADEPTGNLDTETGHKIFDLLLSLNGELKTTLVVVTHNEELASKMDGRIIITDGKITHSN